jgi:hypothetical protein
MLRPYFASAIMCLPENGRLALAVELDFSASDTAEVDLSAELMQPGGMGTVQGIFIDNGTNNAPMTLTFPNTSNQGFVLRVTGRMQTWQPLLVPAGLARFRAVSVAAPRRKVEIHLVNFPVQPIMWNVP